MSERKLRILLIDSNIYGVKCKLCDQVGHPFDNDRIDHTEDCPLADDPDVVKVLRYLDARRHWGDRVESEGNRAKDKNVEIAGMLSATECRFIADWIADTFHIRLTETGWEWTDE